MQPEQKAQSSSGAPAAFFGPFNPAVDYMIDAAQRSVLFFDVMRQRGNQYREHLTETAPHVLDYEVELVLDGRTSSDRSITSWPGLSHPKASRSIPRAGRSSSSIRAPGMARALAASSRTAKSASRSRPDIPVISSASCPTRCRAKPSKISPAPKPCSSKKSLRCIPRPTASRA